MLAAIFELSKEGLLEGFTFDLYTSSTCATSLPLGQSNSVFTILNFKSKDPRLVSPINFQSHIAYPHQFHEMSQPTASLIHPVLASFPHFSYKKKYYQSQLPTPTPTQLLQQEMNLYSAKHHQSKLK